MEELKNDNTTLKDNHDVLAAKVDILSAPKKVLLEKYLVNSNLIQKDDHLEVQSPHLVPPT
jgi:hypothetical protein